jgi:MoaA/NifB/PqqE/SkfB family radical SAM enzyme
MKRKPGYLQITRDCNNDCLFCSNPAYKKNITLQSLKKEIHKLLELGINDLAITGGEPTTSDNLIPIIKYLKKINVKFKLITNGVKLENLEFCQNLYKVGLRKIHVSIHHYNEKKADQLSQKKGHFKKVLQGIQNCLNIGLDLQTITTINSYNAKELDKLVIFLINKFPKLYHFVFNGLDPGMADCVNLSKAGENKFILPKFIDFELSLHKMVQILKSKNKTFRIERVPLCYMQGFEEFSTETRKKIKGERYICDFVNTQTNFELRQVPANVRKVKSDVCKFCFLNDVCVGLQKEYAQIYGRKELFPVFIDKNLIINKILKIN